MSALNFEKMFSDYVAANARVFANDRKATIGASEAFGCLRKSYFGKFGEEEGFVKDDDDDASWGAMERGNIIENHFVVPAISGHLPEGQELLYGGEDQFTFVSGRNSATPDGLIVGLERDALSAYGIADIEADCIGLEIKSIDPRVNLDEEKSIHHGQAQVQMGLIREKTKYKPVYVVILYVDASFLDQIMVFPVKWEPKKWAAAQARAKFLFEATSPADIQAEGKLSGECRYCPWKEACAAVSMTLIPESEEFKHLPDKVVDEMARLLVEERALDKKVKSLETEHGKLKQGIKDFLAAHDTRRIKGEGWSVSWSSQDGKKTLDKAALEAAGVDLSQFTKVGAGFDKLNIRMKDNYVG